MISSDLLSLVCHSFALPLDGIHGEAHWRRVHENGLRLASQTGAHVEAVELFAYLHDSRRHDDGWDREHGPRAAEFVRGLPAVFVPLPDEQLELLIYAIAHHSDSLTQAEITVQTCWDADRLDLGRIGIVPDPRYLCTEAAKDPAVIDWAFRRSRK